MRIDSARRAFGSDAQVARALDVDASQIARWKQGQPPGPANADRLVGLDAVIEMLTGFLPDSRIPKWLSGPNAHLDNRTPLFVLRSGDTAAVIRAIQATKSGVYA